ncbi:aromatic-L-amino-acid decarboxylase [Fusarium acutatum]|uniref:Aromatic-L-amino-acid decarboxylase n=1 Tax=Fusarium acutatum TaxID=78861 RepID=A0A8H4NEU7_9HYPO|nr:aromatic-L-amino-acid decarboxylase [Fusarium acutatum]
MPRILRWTMSRPQILFLSCIGFAVALTAMLYGNIIKPSTVTSVFSKTMSTRPVVVVGSGLAGLSASYEALQRGAPSVHLLDRAPKPGGNSIKASSGINGAGTKYQRAAGVESDTLFYSDSVRSAGSRFHLTQPPVDREALITKLTAESAAAVNWLVDEIGVDLSVVAPLGGHSVARTHRGAGKTPPGAAIIIALLNKLKENEKFSITNLAEVKALLKEGNTVKGVEYEFEGKKHNLEGSVLFASGGFAGDATGLLARYRPDLKGIPSTNEERPGSHDILTAVGAELLDMDSVQIHPTGFVDPATPNSMLKFLAAEMLRGEGGILLSPEGSRFVNEMDTREHVSNAIMKLPTATDGDGVIKQWDITILLDPGASAVSANHIGFYEWKGLLKKVKVRDLKPAQIAAVDKYAKAVAEGTDDEFGRKQRGRWTLKAGEENRDENIYIGRVTPITHFTMGGVAIDEKARVLTKNDDKLVPIPGLFAAGEITGGIHGDNRLGGSSLLECVVYGRTAGAEVVGSAQCESQHMYEGQGEHDNLVWDKNDEDFEAAQQQMRLKTFCRKVEGFVQQKFGRSATLISPLIIGGFNILYRLIFSRIGSLLQTGKDKYEVAGRPVTLNMTEMVRLANIPRSILPPESQTYTVADKWYTVLAEMHVAQLVFQHNDLVTSEDDCRTICRASGFLKILGHHSQLGFCQKHYHRALLTLAFSGYGVMTFAQEYTYAGPKQFILDPPWWLLLETAEMWSQDLEDWRKTYESRLGIWLSAMEKAEASMGTPAYNTFPVPLSRYMRESWQTGRFFLSYAARKSWAFDAMYWNLLDERFFGDRDPGVVKGDLWKTRIDLLMRELLWSPLYRGRWPRARKAYRRMG